MDRQEGERAARVASVRRGGRAVPYWQQSPSVLVLSGTFSIYLLVPFVSQPSILA